MPEHSDRRVGFENGTPILRVRNLERSVAHYVDVLGFRVDWHHGGYIAGLARDRCGLMLCAGHQGHPGTWVWIGVEDAEALFQEYTAAGATIGLPPTNYLWGLEMQVLDPDGHVLRFASEPREGEPTVEWVGWYIDTPEGVKARRP